MSSYGMHRETGQRLTGLQHLAQSVRDILTTPIGSRVLRREYGSNLHTLVDHPVTPRFHLAATVYVAEALKRWEPRFVFKSLRVLPEAAGQLAIELEGDYRPLDGGETRPVTITNLAIAS